MNDLEFERWLVFQSKHKKAKKIYNERSNTGIGEVIIAIAKYRIRKIRKDITDYGSW